MGRPQLDLDMEAALDLIERGEKVPAIAAELGCSPPTLRARIAELSKEQGLLLQYRAVQSLQLTALQAKILESVTPEKIESAPFIHLIQAFKILKQNELVMEGKPSEIKGLVAHLIHLEKQEKGLIPLDAEEEDAVYSDNSNSITDITLIDDTIS